MNFRLLNPMLTQEASNICYSEYYPIIFVNTKFFVLDKFFRQTVVLRQKPNNATKRYLVSYFWRMNTVLCA